MAGYINASISFFKEPLQPYTGIGAVLFENQGFFALNGFRALCNAAFVVPEAGNALLGECLGELKQGVVLSGKQRAVAVAVGGAGSGNDQYNGCLFQIIGMKKGAIQSTGVHRNGGGIGFVSEVLRL